MRSPHLMSRADSGLLVIDVQKKLMERIKDRDQIVAGIVRLVEAARILGMPVQATEHYPKGIGPTVPELDCRLPDRAEKLSFSCCGLPEVTGPLESLGVRNVLLAGIETHVCVQQTALDLLAHGFGVYAAVDAIGSSRAIDREVALRRMEHAGVVLTTTEAALFEWIEVAGTPEFKQVLQLITTPDCELLKDG